MHIQGEGKNGEIFNFFNVYSRTHKYTQILILKWNRSDGPSKLNEAFIQYKYNRINNIFLDKNFRIKFFWGSINYTFFLKKKWEISILISQVKIVAEKQYTLDFIDYFHISDQINRN